MILITLLTYYFMEKMVLTHKMQVLPSYWDQCIDLLFRSIDWFLNEDNTGI